MAMPMTRSKELPSGPTTLSTREIVLGILVPIGVLFAFAWWAEVQAPTRTLEPSGTIEVRENWSAFLAAIGLCLASIVFASAVLLRRRWRRLWLLALVGLIVGLLAGGIIASRMAVSGVMRFSPIEASIVEPPWLGGKTRVTLVYSEIEWLRRRQLIRWERSWHPVRYALAWFLGVKPGWRRFENSEFLVKRRGQDERILELGLTVSHGWDEIVQAARAARVQVKPVERLILTSPPDDPGNGGSPPRKQ